VILKKFNLVINHLIWLQINGSHFFNLFASIVANACTNALIVNYPDNKINKYLEKIHFAAQSQNQLNI
jgi:hypothetical protein